MNERVIVSLAHIITECHSRMYKWRLNGTEKMRLFPRVLNLPDITRRGNSFPEFVFDCSITLLCACHIVDRKSLRLRIITLMNELSADFYTSHKVLVAWLFCYYLFQPETFSGSGYYWWQQSIISGTPIQDGTASGCAVRSLTTSHLHSMGAPTTLLTRLPVEDPAQRIIFYRDPRAWTITAGRPRASW